MNKTIVGWITTTHIENNVGINNEQYDTVQNYEPIFKEDLKDALYTVYIGANNEIREQKKYKRAFELLTEFVNQSGGIDNE